MSVDLSRVPRVAHPRGRRGGDNVRLDTRETGRRIGWWTLLGLGATALLGGCATNDDVLAVRRDMAALRNEVATLTRANQSARDFTEERLQKVEAEMRGRVESSMKESEGSRVALNQRVEEMTTETRFVQGKLEENASVLRDAQTRLDEVDQRARQAGQRVEATDQQVKAMDQQLKTMGQRVQALEQARAVPPPAAPLVAPGGTTPQAPGTAIGPAPVQAPAALPPVAQPAPAAPVSPQAPGVPPVVQAPTAPPAAPAAPAPAPARPQAVLPPEDLYKTALSDYTKGDYDLAITGFRGYLQTYPRTSLAPNAQYWLAECYFSQKNYKQAIEEFDVVIREHADSPKVPSALFKQGEAYTQMGDTKQATAAFCELIGKHGRTREARLARDKNIRCR